MLEDFGHTSLNFSKDVVEKRVGLNTAREMVPLKNWQALNCMIYCPDNH
jgi:hypothetical protein